MADARTLAVYAARARDYAKRFAADNVGLNLRAFIEALPTGARVLDLGCGPGNAAAAMRDAGLAVEAWDASTAMAEAARELHGLELRVAEFDALDAEAAYDGIYANFSLLHAPKSEMPGHLARIARALQPGGLFHIGLKTGEGERRDTLGRLYAYYGEEEIAGLLEQAGFKIIARVTGRSTGLDGTSAPWIILRARKAGRAE